MNKAKSSAGSSRTDDRILVVNHDPTDAAAIEHELVRAGYVVEMATDAGAVLDRLASNTYDAVLTDAGSPDLWADRLQSAAFERDPDIAVLIVAATPDISSAVKCLREGAFDYITKPVDPLDLRRRVHTALERRRSLLRSRRRNIALEEQVAEQSVKINQLKLLSIQALNHALEAKDESTRNHSTRVAILSRAIAEHMGVADEIVLETFVLSGLLHDVGKIGVPEYVLNKPAALDASEFEHIRRHPELGEMILKPLLAADVLSIVRSHHERWDGLGYPDGLAGSDIPLGARIVAVADSYDAMTSHRPYRAGMTHERALSVLVQGAGSQWDPQAASAMIAVAEQGAVEAARTIDDIDLGKFGHLGVLFVEE